MTNAGINTRSSRNVLKEFGKFKGVVTVAPIEKRQVKFESWARNL
ncbi:515_t:CDS:1, partial [Paraglomus occultum]